MEGMLFSRVMDSVLESISIYSDRSAFYIADKAYSYEEFGKCISKIRMSIRNCGCSSSNIGIVLNDDLETFSSIFAIWLENKAYVPLHPHWPKDRCQDIIEQVELDMILDSSKESDFEGNCSVIDTGNLENELDLCLNDFHVNDNDLAYILFTSGSTGKPKGVPISKGNVAAFVDSFYDIGFEITCEDRVLQCFDLTFDLSVMSYLIPLTRGACVYTVPDNVVKYTYIYDLMDEHSLTVALMVPSIINYLKPYFDEIDIPSMRYSLFCGEALYEDVTAGWAKCLLNAEIYNVYGPTEDTIFCTYYKYQREGGNKTCNGILSIGKSMSSGSVRVLDEYGQDAKVGEAGELCLYGNQLFGGYWKDKEKTESVFVVVDDGKRYYKTGDLCYKDADGDIMYVGRMDSQAKIQGFRVELGEIEFHAREFFKDRNVVCVAYENESKLTEIAMFIESDEVPTDDLMSYLREKLPSYMIPSMVLFKHVFPLNANGKTDRKELKKMLNER